MRSILVVTTDRHSGGKLALLNPDTVLYYEDENGEDGDPYKPNLTASQKYLWELYSSGIKDVVKLAHGDPIHVLDLGDQTQGNKHPAALVTTRLSDQIVIADYNMRPWFDYKNVKSFRQVIGTGAHNFEQGSSEFLLAQILEARYPKVNIKSFYHGLIDYNGVIVDCAHHGPGVGSRNWLKGNVARFYLRDLMQREIMSGERPPDLVLRGHYHDQCHEALETGGYTSNLYVIPSFSMLGDHAMQVMSSPMKITNGFVYFEIIDGKIVNTVKHYKTQDVRTVEKI